MDEMRADALGPLRRQHQRFALDTGQAADARADRAAGAKARFLGHVEQAGVLDRLAGGVDAGDDEGIDLPLHLVVDAPVGIEAVFVARGLDLAGVVAVEIHRPGPHQRPPRARSLAVRAARRRRSRRRRGRGALPRRAQPFDRPLGPEPVAGGGP